MSGSRSENVITKSHGEPTRQAPGSELETVAHSPNDPTGSLRVRCPHCQQPIELASEAELSEIDCPSCENRFSISGDAGVEFDRPDAQFAHFQLQERLGVGAFGTVWKAQDTQLDRTVAIKIPRKGQLDSKEAESFLREARAAAQLKHPNIVGVFEIGREEDRVYIVSDYVAGGSLAERLQGGPLTSRESAQMCAKLAAALEHAHQHGVIHRDLKPANILLDVHANPQIADFGLAKREAGEVTMTIEGQLVGTPAYMSPEQAVGQAHRAGARSDVYSLGVILFEMLTGELPFRGSMRALLKQVAEDIPPAPRKLNSSVPKDLETICLKCLEKLPGRRYETAGGLAADLTRFLNNEPIEARPVGNVERGWRWCQRKPMIASLAAAVAGLLLFVGVSGPLVALRESTLRETAEENEARAEQLAEDEATARKTAEAQRKKAVALANDNRRQLVRMNVRQGDALLEKNDPAGALSWFAEALRLDQGDAEREKAHRIRLAALWPNLPKFTHLWRHDGEVSHLASSDDGRLIASSSADRTARVWDVSTGEAVTPPLQHDTRVWSSSFNRDGSRLVTCSGAIGANGQLHVWDVQTGQLIGNPINNATATYLAAEFTDSGNVVSVDMPISGNAKAQLWNLATGKELGRGNVLPYSPNEVMRVAQFIDAPRGLILETRGQGSVHELTDGGRKVCTLQHDNTILYASFSRDGSRILTTEWNKLHVWDAQTGERLGGYSGLHSGWTGYHAGMVAEFSADNSRVTIAGDRGQFAQLLIEKNDLVHLRSLPGVQLSKPFVSGDGRFAVAAAQDQAAYVWDARYEQLLMPPLRHPEPLTYAVFTPDNRRLVTACGDGSIRVWDAATVDLPTMLTHQTSLIGVDQSTDGKEIVLHGRHWLRRADIETHQTVGKEFYPGNGTISTHALVERELYAAGNNDHTAQVWSYTTGEAVSPPINHDRPYVGSVKMSPNGEYLATISVTGLNHIEQFFGHGHVWRVETGERVLGPITFPGLRSAVVDVEFSSDSRTVAFGGGAIGITGVTPNLKLIDLASGDEQVIPIGAAGDLGIGASLFAPSGNRIVVSGQSPTENGCEIRIWDSESNQFVGQPHHFSASPNAADVDPSANMVAMAIANQVHLIRLDTAVFASAPLSHADIVTRIDFSADGAYLATACQDNTARLWNVETGHSMTPPLVHPEAVNDIELFTDGRLVTACEDGTARVFDLRPTDRSMDDLERMSRLLGPTDAVQSNGLEDWQYLSKRYPEDFQTNDLRIRMWHRELETKSRNNSDWSTAAAHVAEMLKTAPGDVDANLRHGAYLCQMGQFGRGGDSIDKAIELSPNYFYVRYCAAAARLRSGDLDAYREKCRNLVERFGDTENPWEAMNLARICLLGPSELDDPSVPGKLIDRAMQLENEGSPTVWTRLVKVLADYRYGNYEQAKVAIKGLLDESSELQLVHTAKILQAMTLWQLDELEKAQQTLADITEYRERHPVDGYRDSWLAQALDDVLQEEAAGLLKSTTAPTALVASKPRLVAPSTAELDSMLKRSVKGVEEAIDMAQRANSFQLPEPIGKLLQGEALILAEEPQRAAVVIGAAIDAGANEHWYAKSLGWALAAAGRKQEAADAFRMGLKDLGEFDPTSKDADPDHWICAYFLDLVSADQFAQRWQDDESSNGSHACFAWFYIGQRAEIEGRTDDAIRAYEKSVRFGKLPDAFHVYHWAAYRLQKLGE